MIKISEHHAVKIAIDIKKEIVKQEMVELTQEELEVMIFKTMEQYGYSQNYIDRYLLVSKFQ